MKKTQSKGYGAMLYEAIEKMGGTFCPTCNRWVVDESLSRGHSCDLHWYSRDFVTKEVTLAGLGKVRLQGNVFEEAG